jgi:HlyD family secretion protein
MRRDLERLRVGSRLSLLDAETVRAENGRNLQAANTTNLAAKSDLEALVAERDAFLQQTRSETSQQLVAQRGKLSEALDERNKRDLRRRLVDLRAERDGVVLTVAKVSVGSVMQSGEALMTLVPNEVVLEVEASIAGRDAGFVQSGNAAVIKFDTFSYTTYGYAVGTVRTVSGDSFVDPQSVGGPAARPGAVQPEGGRGASFYRARVSLDDVRLHNLPGSLHLTQGMPVTVDIKVGEHTIIAYFAARVIPVLSEGLREP